LDRTITITEALTSCSLDEAARLANASDLKIEIQRRAEKKAGG
jgi:hypothetical protein